MFPMLDYDFYHSALFFSQPINQELIKWLKIHNDKTLGSGLIFAKNLNPFHTLKILAAPRNDITNVVVVRWVWKAKISTENTIDAVKKASALLKLYKGPARDVVERSRYRSQTIKHPGYLWHSSVLILDDAPTTNGESQPVSTQLKHKEMDEGKGIKTIVDSFVKLNETEIGNAFFRKR